MDTFFFKSNFLTLSGYVQVMFSLSKQVRMKLELTRVSIVSSGSSGLIFRPEKKKKNYQQ